MSLDNLLGKGLQREPTDAHEIRRFRDKIRTRIADAAVCDLSLESRFDIAYEALLQLGLAALRAHGYRPDSRGGHHVLALQTLPKTLGVDQTKVRIFDQFRRQRAAGLYDGSFEPSEAELNALLVAVTELHQHFEQWLVNHHPELV